MQYRTMRHTIGNRTWTTALLASALAIGAYADAEQNGEQESLVDSPLPAFTMNSSDGSMIVVDTEGDQLAVSIEGERRTPKAMLIHFFQPDCEQCLWEMEALQQVHRDYRDRGVLVLGVAHRGDRREVLEVAEKFEITYPLAIGVGGEVTKRLSAGDSLLMVDAEGVIRYRQAGYRPADDETPGDEKLWRENLDRLVDGKPVKRTTVDRDELRTGDQFPVVRLDDIYTGEEMELSRDRGRLAFRDAEGEVVRPAAAIGLFSRYCEFTREEMQFFQRLKSEYGDDGLFVFTIAMMPNRDATPEATRQLGVTYPVFAGYGSELGKRYAYGCPAYILDQYGIIRYTQVGFEEEDEQKYKTFIEEALRDAQAANDALDADS